MGVGSAKSSVVSNRVKTTVNNNVCVTMCAVTLDVERYGRYPNVRRSRTSDHEYMCTKEHTKRKRQIMALKMYPTGDKGSLKLYTPVRTWVINDSYNLELTCAYKSERETITNDSSPQFCGKAVEKHEFVNSRETKD